MTKELNPYDESYLNSLIERAFVYLSEKLGKKDDVKKILQDEAALKRIKDELKPVLTILKDLIGKVAQAIASNKIDDLLVKRSEFAFSAHQCPITIDSASAYTTDKNPATIQLVDGKLKLMVSAKFKNEGRLSSDYLKELIHEQGALLLIDQLKEKQRLVITNEIILSHLKSQLLFKGTGIGLTHFIDAVLLSRIEECTK